MSSSASYTSGSAPATVAVMPATLKLDPETQQVCCEGNWTVYHLAPLDRRFRDLPLPDDIRWQLNTQAVHDMDTAGALLLFRILEHYRAHNKAVDSKRLPHAHRALLELIQRRFAEQQLADEQKPGILERLGKSSVKILFGAADFLSFIGEFTLDTLPRLLRPWQIRGRQIIAEIYKAGVSALPIVGLLAFLMGVVIAYQGGIPLEQYGANIFLVELVAITMLREMGPLLTAIIVAGRTGSAYAAQIGTMRITDEIDALRSLGVSQYEVLALPKLIGLIVALPLLSLFATAVGIFGGMLIADSLFGVDYQTFLRRMPESLANSHFWVGMIKTPIFACIIALTGCYYGFRVEGSAESVGRATTVSVVQGIFLVITADALFSIVFSMLDL
ncbi:hypothetical protein CAI21_03435 [Alkalilimnicola ehrlichii]|uniref:Uncharacterized protein n=1 Tax=Alkalilimnicola ehrlichii TaxID=351052 RepID=A0A3E0X2D8_9GAMM|nr:ABC transporter permease [Alkalilimnicola ehrlichii]RFA31036.1 hypothetical protein CAI21_03435 [Alkalilimnicola ehrlichii]RFA38989.1 hypothetical protein CAL65_03585 [Alkalilimnicola ehrlichii]